ncbi:MAG: FAD-dependent oxidoreductase, partial [Deltaproteobacteria bacterium]|nr:FAD-dependent oxidoreductase [Deltaproteobacteria bacterium]
MAASDLRILQVGEQGDIVIIGGSAAGVAAASAIVEAEHRGTTVLITAEDRLPYKRTKVSKSFAKGFSRDGFAIQEPSWFEQAGIELKTGTTVTAIDLDGQSVALADGSARHWDELILATGARPRQLTVEPAARDRVFFAHDIAQVEALRRRAASKEDALVIGLGVLGTEVAEQLVRMGKRVTMVGDTEQVMTEHLNEIACRKLADVLAQQGVRLLFGETVGQIASQGDRVCVDLQTARQQLGCDMVVCCIGLEVRSELARQAGLTTDHGIVVDDQLRTSHPQVLAAGDVAEHPGGRLTHLWRHAQHQGRVAGINAAGGAATYEFVP